MNVHELHESESKVLYKYCVFFVIHKFMGSSHCEQNKNKNKNICCCCCFVVLKNDSRQMRKWQWLYKENMYK